MERRWWRALLARRASEEREAKLCGRGNDLTGKAFLCRRYDLAHGLLRLNLVESSLIFMNCGVLLKPKGLKPDFAVTKRDFSGDQ